MAVFNQLYWSGRHPVSDCSREVNWDIVPMKQPVFGAIAGLFFFRLFMNWPSIDGVAGS
jgi:hypothetical protein